MKFWTKIKWRKLLRSLHRDLGYFFIGLTFIYALSGIFLIERTGEEDPAYSKILIEKKIKQGATPKELKNKWKQLFPQEPILTKIIPRKNHYTIYVKGGMGEYLPQSGFIYIEIYKKRNLIKFMNDIHYNQGNRFTWLAFLYAIGLLFFSISGLVIVKGKKGFKKRGVWIMFTGLLIPVLWYYLF